MADVPKLPEGWSLTEHLLTADLQIDLLGSASVLCLDLFFLQNRDLLRLSFDCQ